MVVDGLQSLQEARGHLGSRDQQRVSRRRCLRPEECNVEGHTIKLESEKRVEQDRDRPSGMLHRLSWVLGSTTTGSSKPKDKHWRIS